MASASPARVAFFDTNALIALYAYWEVCKDLRVNLGVWLDVAAMQHALAGSGKPDLADLSKDARAPLDQGLNLFGQMSSRQTNWRYYTSIVCLSEMHHVLLEALATEKMTIARSPRRRRFERPLIAYRQALSDQDYNQLDQDLAEFWRDLEDRGVLVERAELLGLFRFEQVAAAAQELWSRVLVDVMDGLIWASAALSMARIIICRDEPLRAAINGVRDAKGPWGDLRLSLDTALARVLGANTYDWPASQKPGRKFPG